MPFSIGRGPQHIQVSIDRQSDLLLLAKMTAALQIGCSRLLAFYCCTTFPRPVAVP